MAYASWSVTFGEQPSAAKWNILGTNDSFFNDQVGTGFGSGTTSKVWWEELTNGRTTLTGAGDTISTGTFAARRHLKIIATTTDTGGTTNMVMRFNADSGNNYQYKESVNFGAGTDNNSASSIGLMGAVAAPILSEVTVFNIATDEKTVIGHNVIAGTAGAANATTSRETFGKWANTSDSITSVSVINSGGTGDFAIGSTLVVLGHD